MNSQTDKEIRLEKSELFRRLEEKYGDLWKKQGLELDIGSRARPSGRRVPATVILRKRKKVGNKSKRALSV